MIYPHFKPSNSRVAVTLVELLVAMAGLALLAGILLPSVLAGRQASLQLKCKNQMRQLVMDRLEAMNTPDIDSLRFCPNDSELAFREQNGIPSYAWTVRLRLNDGFWIKKNHSSRIMVLFEAAPNYYDEYVDPFYWFNHHPHDYDPYVAKERVYSQIDPRRHHNSVANYAFADGHIESIAHSQIEDWIFDQHNFETLSNEIR